MTLASLLTEHLKKRWRAEKPEPRSYFYISEAGKRPYQVYKAMMVKQKCPPPIKRVMEAGKKTHRLVCKYLGEMGFLKAEGVKVGDNLFRGYVDAIIHLPGEKPEPLEIKTVSKKWYEEVLRRGIPTWQSYVQLQLYINYLRKVQKGRILFIEANTLKDHVIPLEEYIPGQRMKEFEVRKNPKIIRQTIQKFRKLREVFIRDGVMLRR